MAIFAADFLLPLSLLPWLAGALALTALLLLLTRKRWILGFGLTALGLALGFGSFFLHAQRSLVPALQLDGETRIITGEVCSYPQSYETYSRVELRIGGEGLPGGKMILYAEGDTLLDFAPGELLRCEAKLKRPDLRYGERYDSYISRGVYLTGNAKSLPEKAGKGSFWRSVPLRLNRALTTRVDEIFPGDTAAFMKSLMLGDKSDLYQDLALHTAMSRAGFLHIVAVSGMHIAFLVGLIQLLFGKTPRSSVLCLLLIWLFVPVTGSSPSAVRAAIMQSFLLTAPLVKRENDAVTSLSAALGLILAINPYAAGSVSLQLSFSAMAGILALGERLQENISSLFPERLALRLRAPISTAASSLAVLAFSAPIIVWHFGSLSLLSPVTNILGLWAVSFCFCGGYLSCLLSFLLLPLGTGAAWLVSWLARYLFWVARLVSGIPFAVLYCVKLPSYLWIGLVYALSLLFAFSRMRRVWKVLLPLLLSCAMLALMFFAIRRDYRSGSGTMSVIDVGQGQSLAVMSGEETLVIDCGGINSLQNAGETAGSYLIACGRDHVDTLLLTHLHADHVNGVPMLMEMLPVKNLILPQGVDDEDGMLETILAAAARHAVHVEYLEEDEERSVGGIHMRLFVPTGAGDANERCLTGVFSLGDYDMLVTGDSSKSTEREMLRLHPLQDLELLIVGHHGSRYASSGELLGAIGADTAVISTGYNTFGHPTTETLQRLDAYGYRIYRTDLNGTVEIRVGN